LEEFLVFDVWAPFAYFRKSATTTTALSFSFMPRTCIEGLIGSILGFRSADYPERLKDAEICLQIVNKVNKMSLSLMHTHTDYWREFGAYLKGNPSTQSPKKVFRAPAKIELLIEPRYRIYFGHEELMSGLKDRVSKHETVFTPYLGSSSMIANFSKGELCKYHSSTSNEPVAVSSIIPFFDKMPQIYVEPELRFAVEQNIPIHITKERNLTGTFSAVYSPSADVIKVKGMQTTEVFSNGGKSVFVIPLPTEIASK
jgi:CRISPR-associated protein Cas5h